MTKFNPPASEGAGFFINADEKTELIKSGEPVTVVAVEKVRDTYQGKTRDAYKVTFDLDGEERGWSFGIGSSDGSETSRDRLLAALADYLEQDDAEVTQLVIGKTGSFYTLDVPEED